MGNLFSTNTFEVDSSNPPKSLEKLNEIYPITTINPLKKPYETFTIPSNDPLGKPLVIIIDHDTYQAPPMLHESQKTMQRCIDRVEESRRKAGFYNYSTDDSQEYKDRL